MDKETLQTDILNEVYNRYIVGDEEGDNLNPEREVKLTSSDDISQILNTPQFSSSLAQAESFLNEIKAREPEDFDEVIKAVLEDAVISAGGPDGTQKVIDAKKLGLDSLDIPLLSIANVSPSIAPSAINALEHDIAIEIIKSMLYLKAKELIGKPPLPDIVSAPSGDKLPSDEYFKLTPVGPYIRIPEGDLVYMEFDDPEGPSLDLPDEFTFEDGIWKFGPSPGPIPPINGPLTGRISVGGPGPSSDEMPEPEEIEIPEYTPGSDDDSGSGSGNGSNGGSGSGSGGGGGSSSGSSSNSEGSSSGSGETPGDEPPEEVPPPPDFELPPPPPPRPGPEADPEFEDFFTINCNGTLSLILQELGSGPKSGRYNIGRINEYINKNGTDGAGNGADGDERNAFDQFMMGDSGTACVQYQLTILQILLVIVKIIKVIAAMIDPVGMIAAEIARMIALIASAWHNPPAIGEVIEMLAGKIKTILIKLLGTLLNMLYGLAPGLFCAISNLGDIISQLKDTILAIGSIGVEIDNLASAFVNANRKTQMSIKDMVSDALEMCATMLNDLNPDKLTQGAKNFKDLWTTTKNAAKNNGFDFSSGKASLGTAKGLLEGGIEESGNPALKQTYEDAMEAVKSIQEMKNAAVTMMSQYQHTFSQAGSIAQIGTLFTKKEEGSWQDWNEVVTSWGDFTSAGAKYGKAWANGAKPLITAMQTNSLEQQDVKDEYDDPRTVFNPDGSSTEEHKKLYQMEEYQKAKKGVKKLDVYKEMSRPEQIGMLNSLAQAYANNYTKEGAKRN